jgi:hypothetical protein
MIGTRQAPAHIISRKSYELARVRTDTLAGGLIPVAELPFEDQLYTETAQFDLKSIPDVETETSPLNPENYLEGDIVVSSGGFAFPLRNTGITDEFTINLGTSYTFTEIAGGSTLAFNVTDFTWDRSMRLKAVGTESEHSFITARRCSDPNQQ